MEGTWRKKRVHKYRLIGMQAETQCSLEKNPTKRKNKFRIEHVSQSKAHIFRKNVEVLKLKLIQAILISTRYEVKNFTAINDYYD